MLGRPNVLLIGAAEGACAELASVLEALGATIQPVGDCLTAMAAVKSDGIDLAVLADCGGEFNAVETARVLKSLRRDKYLPVMLLAAKGLPDGQTPATLEDGIDDILAPPFDERVLEWRLQALLHLKSAHDQLRDVRSELQKTLARENALLVQLREDNRDLKARSTTDGLTALYNYRYLMEWLKTEFKVSRRYGHALSMIIVDIDFFKRINDEHGHPFGDLALKEVAVILKQCARDSDLVARYAGDEFALVCPRTGQKEIQALAKRILTACRKYDFMCKGQHVNVTMSLGIATYPDDAEVVSPELLVFLADQALYQTKRLGRNGITAWSEIDADTRVAIRREIRGPENPLLADDPRSRVELAAAARLAGTAAEPTSLRLCRHVTAAEP